MTTAAETTAAAAAVDIEEVRRRVAAVPDPELPVLTLSQLGVIRDVRAGDGEHAVVVEITPTYSGCPALEVMSDDIAEVVRAMGYRPEVRVVLAPPWSTDWITAEGRKALLDAGIAPPARAGQGPVAVQIGRPPLTGSSTAPSSGGDPSCPLCRSTAVEELARFGSTACKALWRCLSCREPFDYVKPR